MSGYLTRGVLFVHSAPRALTRHIEWEVSNVLGMSVSFDWTDQPAANGTVRTEYSWQADAGTGAMLASGLRGWDHLRYEVTEEASHGVDGTRYSHTPELGIFCSAIDAHGNLLINEDRVRRALDLVVSDSHASRLALELALGSAWDEELEPFRYAGDGAPVRWLHRAS